MAESACQEIDTIIRKSGDWRGRTLSRLRGIVLGAGASVVEEVKWKKPSRPEGVPVWSLGGIVCIGEMLKNAVRLTFSKGAQLNDPEKLFNARLDSSSVRAIDFREGEKIPDAALKALVLGWDGDPAAGDELVVVTHRPLPEAWLADHPDAPFHTAGSVEAGIALAKKLAGDGLVCVTAGDLGGQAFSAGLVDEIAMDVAPVVLGEGVRFFGSHADTVLLNDPDQVVQGDRVLHLHYTVQR